MNNAGVSTTVLHKLPLLGAPGLGIVRRLSATSVLGVDMGLDSLSNFLARERISPGSSAFIMDENGILLAHSDPTLTMNAGASGAALGWVAIGSSHDPLLRTIWMAYATDALEPGRVITLKVGGEPYRVRMANLDAIGSPPSLLVIAAPVSDFTRPVDEARNRTLALFLAAGIGGLVLILLVSRLVTRPLAGLAVEADAIRRFDLDRAAGVSSHITEVEALAGNMEAMKAAVRTFALYVPKDLVHRLVSGAAHARLGGERRDLTVLFTDIVDFTTTADVMDAGRLTRMTSLYFERMTREVMAADGTVDKYIGDAVMALWGAPSDDEAHAAHACLAALRCDHLSRGLAEEFAERGWPALNTRFGLNTGEAVVGNVGSSDRMSYTAIGASVNMASRLEGLNKHYGTRILVGDVTRREAGADFVFRQVDRVLPKGRKTAADIHELLGLRRALAPRDEPLVLGAEAIEWAQTWDALLAAYLARRFADCGALLDRARAVRADPMAALFAERLEAFAAEPPPADWDGVTVYQQK
jgi:adenylate cyclase